MIEEEDKTEEQQEEPQEAEEAPEETPAEEPAAEEAPAEEPEGGATEGSAEEDSPPAADAEAEATDEAGASTPAEDDDSLNWKTRRRLERSRQSGEARPPRSPEERQSERSERRAADAVLRRRHRQSRRNRKGEPRTGTPVAEHHPNPVKVRQGIVVSDAADKTITVRIDIARRHPTYEKIVRRSRTLRAHDESNEAGQGDVVRVIETRPISKSKRWRLVEVVEKAK